MLQYARDDFETVALLCSDYALHQGKSQRAMILMLVEPAKLVGLREALQSIADRVPALHLWLFDPTRQPVLRGVTRVELGQILEQAGKPSGMATPGWVGPVVASGTERWSQTVTSPEPERNPGAINPATGRPGPNLRLTLEPVRRPVHPAADDAPKGSDEAGTGTGSGANPPVLTNEELTMLLGDDSADDGKKGGGHDAGRA